MEQILPYLINTALGAGGGWLGNMLKANGLGTVGNLIAGAVGGNVVPLIAGALMSGEGLSGILSYILPLVGGTLGSLLGGMFKKAA
ncbi:MAG: hypothetical protein ACKVT2_00120 [Saprospiraceae bacterium]